MVKRFLQLIAISLFVIIILLFLTPILFKDQIKHLVLTEVNRNLTAELSLGEFDLTFLSTFPDMTIELHDTRLLGKDRFKNVELANIKKLQAHIGLWSVIGGDQVEIDAMHITDPVFDLRVLEDGIANYDIVKPDSLKTDKELDEPSSFKLRLKEYSVNGAIIKYDDRPMNIYMELDRLIHKGTGDLTADVIDFETTTNINKFSYRMDNIPYLTEVKTQAVVNLLMEFKEDSSKFTLLENCIQLNEVKFSIDGFYEMIENHDNMDLRLNASEATFKQFLSLIPAFYRSGYEGMIASGKMSLNGLLKGKMTETDLPGWDFNLNLKNGTINYPELPGKIENIQVDAESKFNGGSELDRMTIDVPRFDADLGKNSFNAHLSMLNPITDPNLNMGILANMDLSSLKDFIPLTTGENYNGFLDADVNINGRMSDLDKGDFEKFIAEGTVAINDMNYTSKDLPNGMYINSLNLMFSPRELALQSLDAKMGASDFKINGKVGNYFGYLLGDEVMIGDFNFTSNFLDLDELMGTESPEETTAVDSSATNELFLVPGNIDFTLASAFNSVKYDGMQFGDLKGNLLIKDETVKLEKLNLAALGGNVALTGKYDTRDHSKPKMDFGYQLSEINIQDLVKNFVTVESLAPITKYANGKISSNMQFSSSLDNNMSPILNSLNSDGFVRSKEVTIEGFKILEKIEGITKLKNISKQKLQNFYTVFNVTDGKLSVEPFNVTLGKIPTDISGYTTLNKKLNYDLKMNVPKEEIPEEMIALAEKAMKQINNKLPGISAGKLPDFIPLNIKVIGDAKNPTITHDFKEQIMKATGDLKEDIINTVIDAVTDSLNHVVEEQLENLEAEKEKQKAKILAEAQQQADNVKSEGKRAADLVRAEAERNAQKLIDEAGNNILKKKLAEEGAKKIRAEGEDNAEKIEAGANKKADDIMANAQAKADAL